jgi:O-antigen/teichoic acid export membrane protein
MIPSISKNLIAYVGGNFAGKVLAAFANLYGLYIFTRMLTKEDSALIFLLLGYAVWFQLLELGLSQTLQNKFNFRSTSIYFLLKLVLVHYGLLLGIGTLVAITPYLADLLLGGEIIKNNVLGDQVFSIGASILIVTSSNTVIQRVLLIINKGYYGSILLIIQSCVTIIGLFIYQSVNLPNLLVGLLVYLGPQVLVYLPIIIGFTLKVLRKKNKEKKAKARSITVDVVGFSGIGFLSIIFLGSDYYFVSHYLSPDEIISYYLVSRIFFISYVIYYGYVLHHCRRISIRKKMIENKSIILIFKKSIYVGLFCVSTMYILAVILNVIGMFDFITYGVPLSQLLLFFGFLYFMVRVLRDVLLVIIGALDKKKLLYSAHLMEIIIGLGGLYLMTPRYKELGIFAALFGACLISFLFIFYNIIHNKKKQVMQNNA